MSFILLNRSQYIPVSPNGHTAEFLWVSGVFLAVKTLTSFLRTSWHGFPVIKREKSIMFDVFSRHYDTAKWMRCKLNVKIPQCIASDARAVLTCWRSQRSTLNNSCPFLSHIILRQFTNLCISKTFFGYWFWSKQKSWKSDVSFLGQLSYVLRLWYFSSSVSSYFQRDAQPSSGARYLILVGPFVYFHTVHVQTCDKSLARQCGRLYDKYHNLMSWLNYPFEPPRDKTNKMTVCPAKT